MRYHQWIFTVAMTVAAMALIYAIQDSFTYQHDLTVITQRDLSRLIEVAQKNRLTRQSDVMQLTSNQHSTPLKSDPPKLEHKYPASEVDVEKVLCNGWDFNTVPGIPDANMQPTVEVQKCLACLDRPVPAVLQCVTDRPARQVL